MKRRLVPVAMLGILLGLGTAGCGVIISGQNYGSPHTQRVGEGATRADVFANLGTPNSIYRSEMGDVFVYKAVRGSNVLGLYAKIKRTDYVVIMTPDGAVHWAGDVPMGDGYSVPAFPGWDLTHPARTDTLLYEPENYEYNAVLESEGEDD